MSHISCLCRFDSALDNPVLITQARHREHLEECARSLKAFLGKL